MALGHLEEQHAEEQAAFNCKRVVVDLLALFTLQRTGQLCLLERLFDRPLVHQAVFEELLQLIVDERNYVREGRKTIGKINGQYFLSESSPESIQEEISFLETIKDYVKQKTDVSGLSKELQAGDQQLVEVFGTSASNSAVLAAQESVPLLSDDALLRSWIRTERNIEAFSTHRLFQLALSKRLLSKYAYYELVSQLLRCNYRYITVNAELLIYYGRKDGYRSGGDFGLALQELGRADTTLDSMVFVAAEFLAHVWTLRMPPMMKSLITRRVLKMITANHPRDETLKLLLDHLFARMDGPRYSDVYNQVTQFVD